MIQCMPFDAPIILAIAAIGISFTVSLWCISAGLIKELTHAV